MLDPIRHNRDGEESAAEDSLPRIPEPETFPPMAPPADPAGSFEEETRDQLRLLRDRTFNPELRRLVDRIRVNEPRGSHAESAPEIDAMSPEELQLNLHRLFYRARTISENMEMNIAFDPFRNAGDPAGRDIRSSIAGEFTAMMRHLSFTPFAILSYDISAKGYVPSLHDLHGLDYSNMVVSFRDALFQDMAKSRDGILLDRAALREDSFLGKLFPLPGEDEDGLLYFIMVSNLVEEIGSELSVPGSGHVSSFFPSAILMIMLRDGASPGDTKELARTARERLALPLFLLNDSQSMVFSLERFDDLSYTFDVLEYFFTIFLLKRDRVGIRLHVGSSDGSTMQFMMKYIISKLTSKLCSDSVIINVLKDSLIILTEQARVKEITAIFEEYRSVFRGSFEFNEFRAAEFRDAHDVLKKLVLNN